MHSAPYHQNQPLPPRFLAFTLSLSSNAPTVALPASPSIMQRLTFIRTHRQRRNHKQHIPTSSRSTPVQSDYLKCGVASRTSTSKTNQNSHGGFSCRAVVAICVPIDGGRHFESRCGGLFGGPDIEDRGAFAEEMVGEHVVVLAVGVPRVAVWVSSFQCVEHACVVFGVGETVSDRSWLVGWFIHTLIRLSACRWSLNPGGQPGAWLEARSNRLSPNPQSQKRTPRTNP